ncbi:unnamed protein product, partial [Chrysoparadoxa australica]
TGERDRDQLWAMLLDLMQEKSDLMQEKSNLMQEESYLRQKKIAMLQVSSVAPAATTPQGVPPVTLDITAWLKKRGWWREQRPEYSTVFCCHPRRPEGSSDDRVGRDEAIQTLW